MKHLYNPGYNMLKLCKVLVMVQFAKTKTVLGTYDISTTYTYIPTKCFRQTLDFM